MPVEILPQGENAVRLKIYVIVAKPNQLTIRQCHPLITLDRCSTHLGASCDEALDLRGKFRFEPLNVGDIIAPIHHDDFFRRQRLFRQSTQRRP